MTCSELMCPGNTYPVGSTCRPGVQILHGISLLVKLTALLVDTQILNDNIISGLFVHSLLENIFSAQCNFCQIAIFGTTNDRIVIESGVQINSMCSDYFVVDKLRALNGSNQPYFVDVDGSMVFVFSVTAIYENLAKSSYPIYFESTMCGLSPLIPVSMDWLVTCPHVFLQVDVLRRSGVKNQTLENLIDHSFSKNNDQLFVCDDIYIAAFSSSLELSPNVVLIAFLTIVRIKNL